MQAKRIRRQQRSHRSDNKFIARTYTYFMATLVGMLAAGIVGYLVLPSDWLLPLAVAEGALWIFCGWFGWRNPIAIVLPLFSVTTGCVLGLTAEQYVAAGTAHTMVTAGLITVGMLVSLTFYVMISKRDFNWLIGFLTAGFWLLLSGMALVWLVNMPALHVGVVVLGAAVFLCWILFDTSRIVGRWDGEMTPAIGAFELIMDLSGLFSFVLELVDIFGDDD